MDKKSKKRLTNEEVVKKFVSNFELVNYAIRLAENMIKTGRETRVKSDVQNKAMLILEEIHEGKDHFDEIIADDSFYEIDGIYHKTLSEEEINQNRRYRTAEVFDSEV